MPNMCDLSLGNSHWASTTFTRRVSFIVVNSLFHRAIVTIALTRNRFTSSKHHILSRQSYAKWNDFKTGHRRILPCYMAQWSTGRWQCPGSLNHSTDALQRTAWSNFLSAQSHDWRPRPWQMLPFSLLQNFLPLLTYYISNLEKGNMTSQCRHLFRLVPRRWSIKALWMLALIFGPWVAW